MKKIEDLKIGFIGYGRHARNNLYPSLNLLGAKIYSIATTSEESSSLGKSEQGAVSAYSNHKEMLEKEDLDCVFISAPPAKQLELTLDALASGRHVFVEKPLGLNSEEAKLAEEKSKETGKFVMVGFMKRFSPTYQKMYELIAKPEFGKLLTLSGTYACRNFARNAEEMLLFAAIHSVDMLSSIIGEVKELKSFEREIDGSFA